jgi:hypothetical protein
LVNREIKETGTSEDVPRTAAITQIAGEKKSACERMALLRSDLPRVTKPGR